MTHMLAYGMPGGADWLVIAAIGLLLFGKRLPEVGKGLGAAIKNFKLGLSGVEDDIEKASNPPAGQPAVAQGPAQFKFDPHTGKPVESQLTSVPAGARFDPFTGKALDPATTVQAAQPLLESQAK